MPRIPRVPSLQPLQRGIASSSPARPSAFALTRAISTSSPAQATGKRTEWIRSKLWKGEAPGPEDPYTQRAEPEESYTPAKEESRPRHLKTHNPKSRSIPVPPPRTETISEAELKSVDPTYTPAETIAELDQIAPLKSWWDQSGNWTSEAKFKGFASRRKILESEIVEVYLRRALVEALVLRQAETKNWATRKWHIGERSLLDQLLALEIKVVDGEVTLEGNKEGVVERLTEVVSGKQKPEPIVSLPAKEAREIASGWDKGWKETALTPDLKFAIRKRLYQLTGTLIPDARLGAARTVRHLMTLGAKAPPVTKLAEVLNLNGDLPQLANVKVHKRKVRLIEKETAVGRWKVIKEELAKRGLPAVGAAGVPKGLEAKWSKGLA